MKTDNLTREVLLGAVAVGIVMGICIDVISQNITAETYVEVAHAEVLEEPKEVRIEVIYDWDKERIKEEIRKAFPEAPQTAVAIAQCESGLRVEVQSGHTLSYGREKSWGLFQLHEPDWDKKAQELGYGDYKTNPRHNIDMARYIYESAGKRFTPWSCYTKGMI